MVLLVALMAGTLVSGLAVLVNASERFGLPSALTRVDPLDTRVSIDMSMGGRGTEPALAAVDTAVNHLLTPVPSSRTLDITSSFHEVGQGLKLLLYFGSRNTIADNATLTAGSWPAPGSAVSQDQKPADARERTHTLISKITTGGETDPDADTVVQTVDVAIPTTLANDGSLKVGDTFVSAEAFGSERTRAVVTGIYRVNDPEDAFWSHDPLAGTTRDDNFPVPMTNGSLAAPTYGPLITSEAAFESDRVTADSLLATATPHFEGIPPSALLPMLERTRSVQQDLQVTLAPAAERVTVNTQLASALQQVVRFRYVTRTGVVIVALLLVVLALSALLLATRLLAERRFTEQSLMRARGASGRQMIRLALIEAVLLGVITAALSPLLARQLYRLLAGQPAFQRAGLDHDPGIPASAWVVAAGSALVFVLVLISPLLKRSTTFVEQEQSAARQDRRSVIQRSGIDLGLLVLAGVAYWQLRHYDSPLVTVQGQPRLDPVLVAGPALALLAGALVAVRIVPLISRRMEALAKGGRSIVLPLAAWEVGRRPQRAIGAVLLLTLALAIGTFSLSYLSTWQTSQQDQADFQVGADVSVNPTGLDPLAQAAAIKALPGAGPDTDMMPLIRRELLMSTTDDTEFMTVPDNPNGQRVNVLAGDAARMGGYLSGRTVEPGGENSGLIAALPKLAPDTTVDGVALPGRPVALRVTVKLTDPGVRGITLDTAVRAVVQDATGVRQVIDLGFVPADGESHVATGAVPGVTTGNDSDPSVLTPPLRLVAMQASLVPQIGSFDDLDFADSAVGSTLTVKNLRAMQKSDDLEDPDDKGRQVTVPAGFDWSVFSTSDAPVFPEPVAAGASKVLLEARVSASLGFRGSDRTDVTFTRWPNVRAIPGVASAELLDRMQIKVGDQIAVKASGWGFLVDVVASVPIVATTDPQVATLVLDEDLLTRALIERGETTDLVDEWWATAPVEADAIAMTRAVQEQEIGTAVSRAGLARDFAEQPLRVGFQGALWLVIIAAAAFAAIGFAMHTTVAIRLRRVEFSQLRALGITRRSLTSVVAVENLLLCVIGVACGIGLGVLLGWLVGPMVSLAADGSSPVPAVLVVVPWKAVALLALEIVAILVLVVVVVTRVLRRSVLGSVLRLGDER